MPSEKKIQRGNIIDLIRRFAKEYRRELGKVPGEIVIVGGASIMMNYKFRGSTWQRQQATCAWATLTFSCFCKILNFYFKILFTGTKS